jgi:hypothetical protein
MVDLEAKWNDIKKSELGWVFLKINSMKTGAFVLYPTLDNKYFNED